MPKKKIGILGSGAVAQSLAAGFVNHGYDVVIGTRDASKLNDWISKTQLPVKVKSFDETANEGEIIVLAVKGAGAEPLTRQVATHLEGKTVLDTTNPIADAAPENGVLKYTTDLNFSLMEKLQQ